MISPLQPGQSGQMSEESVLCTIPPIIMSTKSKLAVAAVNRVSTLVCGRSTARYFATTSVATYSN